MKKIILLFFCIAVIMAAWVSAAAEDYIVKLKPDARLAIAEKDLTPLVPELGLYTAPDISGLNSDMIEFCEPDAEVRLFDSYDYSKFTEMPEHAITGIWGMWNIGVYGKGIRVGVIDSGCNPHEALVDNLLPGANFADDSAGVDDHIGHGTSVCGMAAAGYGFGVIGAAHKAGIIPLKFIDCDENGRVIGGTVSRLAKAIVSAADDFDCDIINMSCGTIDSHTLELAVDYAESKNVIMIAAVGNSGDEKYNYPAAYDNVIGVGSVSGTKEHSSFSNTNDSVFVTAPGERVNVVSGTGGYGKNSGTSFSAPYVSGIVAIMRNIKPEITLREVMEIISLTAEDLGDEGYDSIFGYGLARADNIVNYMLSGCDYFVSDIDLCGADNFYEIRFRVSNATETPLCVLAEYADGRLCRIALDNEYVSDNIFMLRLPNAGNDIFKYFIWDSFQTMRPIKIYR